MVGNGGAVTRGPSAQGMSTFPSSPSSPASCSSSPQPPPTIPASISSRPRPRTRISSAYNWSTASSGNSSATTNPSQSSFGDAVSDVIYSPTYDEQCYAQETPSEDLPSREEVAAATTELQKAQQAIRRYRLDVDLPEVWEQVDIAFLNQIVAQPSPLTAVFISAGATGTFRVARSDGPMPVTALSSRLVAALASAVIEKQEHVMTISDLGQFFEDRGISRDQLPSEINYISASLLRFAPRHGQPEVPVGIVAAFDIDAHHAQQNQRVVAKVAAMAHTVLRARFLAERRKIELRAQQEMVNLTRLIQGNGSDGCNSTIGHDGDDQVDAQSDERRIRKSASPDIEHATFKQAARAIGRVLRADLVAIFDVSGFKYDKASWSKRPNYSRRDIKATSGSEEEDSGPTAGFEESRVQGFSDRCEDQGDITRTNSNSVPVSPGTKRYRATSSSTETLSTSSGSSSDSDGNDTDRQDDYDASQAERQLRPATTLPEDSDRSKESERKDANIVCSYTKSVKPIPLLAASGRGKSHFKLLPGDRSRALVAKFLASARAAGTPWLSHVEGEQSPLSSDRPFQPRATLLSELLPSGFGGLVALPVFETSKQPAYLILVVFKTAPPAFEDSDRLFIEQVGSSLIASALRIRSQAVDRAQVRLTQRMQHQLRTPLHTIVGMCESAKFVEGCSEETNTMMASIALSAEALDASLSDIFDYSVMAGIKEPTIARSAVWPMTNFRGLFDITSRTSNAAWRLFCLAKAPMSEDRQQVPPPPELIVTCGPGSWDDLPRKFKFDCESLTRVVAKLVTNALQATSRGIVTVNLAVKPVARAEGQKVLRTINDLHLTVSDTGSGMSKDFLKHHVFRPFTKALENTQGTGLSLSICSSVMARLGGRVHVSSELNKGSSFDFVFPFRGHAAPSIKPTGVKVACIPLDDDHDAMTSFVAFVTFLSRQFGADYLGNAEERPELLDEAAIVFIAGERTSATGGREAVEKLIKRHRTRQVNQLLVELPNRAYSDPPNSLKPDRKIVKLVDLEAIQVFRPFVLPDLELMEEIFADVLIGQQEHKAPEEVGTTLQPPKDGQCSTKALPIIIGGARRGSKQDSRAGSVSSTRSSLSVRGSAIDSLVGSNASRRTFLCLVVEDNPLNARILVTLLKRVGVDYIQAKDGLEAVEQFKKHLPQVVLLDINMPRMNGFEAAIEMRKIECPYYPRIIAVTALSLESDKLRGKECGIDDWLPKPVRLAQLAQDVKSWKDEGVWHDEVPREDVSDVSQPPSKEELAKFTTEEAEKPDAIIASAAAVQPSDSDSDSEAKRDPKRDILL